MKILWAITGAGHLLDESLKVLDSISQKHEITIALSNAAIEVIQAYGYKSRLESIIKNNPKNELIIDENQRYSYPLSGKLTHRKYDLIIVSPTTANSVAKIVHGIADTLVTNIIAQSGKGQIPAIVVPVDQEEGLITTILPPFIDKKICKKCEKCIASIKCPSDAIDNYEINSNKCSGCFICKNTCPYNAVVCDKKIELYIRGVDAQNTKKLESIENITTLFNPEDILKYIH